MLAASTWEQLHESWLLALRARRLSPATIRVYSRAADRFTAHTTSIPAKVGRQDVERFFEAWTAADDPSDSYISQVFRGLQQWFKWLAAEGEIDADPMLRMLRPQVAEKSVPLLTVEQLHALLDVCAGRGLAERRDAALLRFMLDTGVRHAEVVGMTVSDVDVAGGTAHVLGKGSRERIVAFGPKTAAALDRYLRVRGRQDGPLWLAYHGRSGLTYDGLHRVMRRRGDQAGIPGLHAHQLRHVWAHRWMAAGGSETDLMTLAGWKSSSMVRRYGASAQAERAVAARHRMPDEL